MQTYYKEQFNDSTLGWGDVDNNTLIKALTFGGHEKTYQAWYGIEDPENLANDRTFNPAGMYFDENGNMIWQRPDMGGVRIVLQRVVDAV